MDALVLDIVVRILSALCMGFLVWGGWLCIGATARGQVTEAQERPEAVFS